MVMSKTVHETAVVIRSGDALGHSLRRIRSEQSLTQSDIAQRSGVKQNAISRIEGGHLGRTTALIFKILAILDLEIVIRPRQKSSAEDIESLFP